MRHTVSRREAGVELVRATFFVDDAAKALLGDATARVESWIDGTLVPYVREIYDADPSPEKRFTFLRFEYALSATVAPSDGGERELILSATLRRARGEPLASFSRRERIRVADGTFLPPEKRKSTQKGAFRSLRRESL